MNLFELAAKITLDSSGYDAGIADAKRSIQGLGDDVGRELSGISDETERVGDSAFGAAPSVSYFGDTLMSLTKLVSVAAVLKSIGDAIINLAKTGITYNMQIETYTANLKVLLGSAEAAEAKIEELKTMDENSPFDLTSLLDATQQLLAYGIAADDTEKVLQQLGDVALGNKDNFNSLALAYSQMNAAGKANMQDIKQMINAGFNPLNAIAELTGETMTELQDRVSAGKVAFSEVQMAIEYATSAVGTFTEEDKKAAAEFAKNQLTISDTAAESLNAVKTAYEGAVEFLEKSYKARQKQLSKEEDALRDSNSDRLDELKKSQEAEIEAFANATNVKIQLINKQYEENLKLIDEEKYRQLKAIDEQINALKGLTEAEKEAAKEKERADEIARLQSQIDNATSNRFRMAAADELNEYLEKIRLEDLENERKAKIEELELQKDAVEAEAEERREKLLEEQKNEVDGVRAEAEAQTKILKEEHEKALKNYRRILNDELEALREKNDSALEEYKKSIDKQKQFLDERYELTVSDIENTNTEVIGNIESVEGRFFEGMATASGTLAGQLSSLESQWNEFLGDAFKPLNETLKNDLIPNVSDLITKLEEHLPGIQSIVSGIGDVISAIVKGISFLVDTADTWWPIVKGILGVPATVGNFKVVEAAAAAESEGYDPKTSWPKGAINNIINITTNGNAEEIAAAVGKVMNDLMKDWEEANG